MVVRVIKDTNKLSINYTNGKLQSITDNSLLARNVFYHYSGEQLLKVTNVLNHNTHYTYIGSGDKLRMSSYTNSESHKTTITYNNTGDVIP